ncbi:MAG: glycosyltransferase [Anaerolineae bacterium]|nr:glycosyltransferase [Anaerolineae bacterium]
MNDLVCISHLRWDFVWQRPQHLLSRLSKTHRVLFVEEPMVRADLSAPMLEVFQGKGAPNVTVMRLLYPGVDGQWIGHGDRRTQHIYARWLTRYLQAESYVRPILWLYTPMAAPFVNVINHRLLIVDVMDQLSAFKGAPAELVKYEQMILPRADLVFTGGVSLYRDKQRFNKATHLFPSGVEVEHFAQACDRSRIECPAEFAQAARPVLGYFGVIDERMDLDLLRHLAEARPNWSVVMVGPVVKIGHDDLPKAPNLHFVGQRTYDELPRYLAHFDVALIPFALNDATKYLSPTKTLEYLAGRKPVVSTPIHDVVELYGEAVHVAHNPEQFVQAVEAALAEPADARRAVQDRLLTMHTWNDIASRMNALIQAQLERTTLRSYEHAANRPQANVSA